MTTQDTDFVEVAVLLHELPEEHALRTARLHEIRAEVLNRNTSLWRAIGPNWSIANNSYNALGKVWKETCTFRVTIKDAVQRRGIEA